MNRSSQTSHARRTNKQCRLPVSKWEKKIKSKKCLTINYVNKQTKTRVFFVLISSNPAGRAIRKSFISLYSIFERSSRRFISIRIFTRTPTKMEPLECDLFFSLVRRPMSQSMDTDSSSFREINKKRQQREKQKRTSDINVCMVGWSKK